MRVVVLSILCVAVLLSEATAKSPRKKHKGLGLWSEKSEKPKDELDILVEDAVAEKEKPLENVIVSQEEEKTEEQPEGSDESAIWLPDIGMAAQKNSGIWESFGNLYSDPCVKKHCAPGEECKVNDAREAYCDCIQECTPELDDRRKICSNHNETWGSDCAVYRMRCLCTKGSSDCTEIRYKHVHIDYYGVCREIEACEESEMSDFPRRMREWLFNVLQDLARKQELSDILSRLEKDAQENLSRKWINAVIWKFCDLDNHPHDRSVSRHELFPLRAPLMAMEHCIAPFLDTCDANDDHIISLVEWGKCLGLEENEIEDKCAFLRQAMITEE